MSLLSLPLAASHPSLTAFFSMIYLGIFLPAALIFYSLTPRRWKNLTLLLESWIFFWLVSGELIIYLLLSTLSMYGLGLWMDGIRERRDAALKAAERSQRKELRRKYLQKSRAVLALAALVHIGMLLVLKYSGFAVANLNALLGLQLPVPAFIVPIGLSFFSLQAFSYLFDVYHDVVRADRNPLRLALFLAFFPQIVEGPICRYQQTARQLWEGRPIRYDNLTLGLQRLLYGMMKKMVVADRLNRFVGAVFSKYPDYSGGIIALAAVAYTVQLYMDFSGSMDAVVGIGQIFGVSMPENFRQPFFSRTISEFWTRWHISLGAWFKDYIFYPISMSGPMKRLTSSARKKLGNHYGPLAAGSIALLCVWVANGAWHGAAWNFLFFGIYHFLWILIGNLLAPAVRRFQQRFGLSPDALPYRLMQILRSWIIIVFGELFFRAESLSAGFAMAGKIFRDFRFDFQCRLYLDIPDLMITLVTLGIVFTVSLLLEKGITPRSALQKKPACLRWALFLGLILYIVIFGAYGRGYVPVHPMYANF